MIYYKSEFFIKIYNSDVFLLNQISSVKSSATMTQTLVVQVGVLKYYL
jgi:hypothetical protein